MLINFLKLSRYTNLLLIIATQYAIKYGFFQPFQIDYVLNDWETFLLCLATVCIAAGGNIINDIYDVETDLVNKPQKVLIGKRVSEKWAFNMYLLLTVLGVGIGFYLSNLIGKPPFTAIFILIAALLYLYATNLKEIPIIGNLIISAMVSMVILVVGLYDLFPSITPYNKGTQSLIFTILLDYAFFAFLVNWLREMVKDQQDVNGDYKVGRRSLPIIMGRKRSNWVIFVLSAFIIFLLIRYAYQYLFENIEAVLYLLVLIVGPLLYFSVNIINAKTKKQFSQLSNLLKFIMLAGILSIILYQFILI